MNTRHPERAAAARRHPSDALRDPALWAWLIVALLAILPAREALALVH
jgi:hypothetical protein